MKRIITAVLALLMATICNGQDVKTHGRASQANNLKSQNMSKSIVIFFSHAGDNYSVGNIEVGNTKIVADYITEIKGADQFEIVTHKYDGMAYMPLIELAKEEANKGELPPYEGTAPDLSPYDTVFIGGPVWWGTYPQVMFTLFKHQPRRQDGHPLYYSRRQRPRLLRQRREESFPESQDHGRVQHLWT